MAADGSAPDLLAGLTVVAIVIAVAVRERKALGLARVLALLLMVGLAFKEGFVRQDAGHLAVFYCGAALIGCILILCARLRYSATVAALVTVFALFSSVRMLDSAGATNVLARDLPASVAQNLHDAFSTVVDWRNRALAFQQGYRAALAPDDLPAGTIAKLATHPVDLVGSEVNVVFANGLDWKPEPVFQPRNAYAPALDALDRDSLSSPASRRELFEFDPVDDRYPLGDQPFTNRAILCNDALDPRVAQPITTSSRNDEFLVLQPAAARCGNEITAAAGNVDWGEAIPVNAPHGSIAFLNVKVGFSPLGLAVKTLYHAPAVSMTIDYADGSAETYRIIPAVALDGLLVDPAPKTLEAFRALLAGTPVDRVKAVRFSTAAPWCFATTVGYRVTTVSYAKP
jgi:hypothetical protein